MILSDRDIQSRLSRSDIDAYRLRIEYPEVQRPLMLQPSSIDLHLGSAIKIPRVDNDMDHRPGDVEYSTVDLRKTKFVIEPRAFILGHTEEKISMPSDLAAQVDGRSTWGRMGLGVHVTAGYIDPGFVGQITLEIFNNSPNLLELRYGDRLCQLIFFQMSSRAHMPYGSKGLGSHYQDQAGATEPTE